MSGVPNSGATSNDEAEHSCQQDMERLAMGVSEMVLKSPTEKSSKLSASAPEFVPSWMKTPANPPPQQPFKANHSTENSFEAPPVNAMSEAEISQYLLSDIRMYVAHLQSSPASFTDVAMTILDLVVTYACDDNTLAAVVDVVFRAGMELENFSYQCARLCGFLAANYWGYAGANGSGPDAPTASFRHVLLHRCRKEHEERLRGPLPGVYNYGLLLADLYNQVKVEDRNVTVLGDAVIAVIGALLSQPNDGNVACAVRILKCCGATLETSERLDNGGGDQAPTPKLDQLFKKFEALLQANVLSEDGKVLVRNLLGNRKDWHKYSEQSGDGFQPPSFDRVSSDTGVFFGPDGEALTAEETAFLERELSALQSSSSGEDEAAFAAMFNAEDDGIDEAYEQFLRMTEEKRKQQPRKN